MRHYPNEVFGSQNGQYGHRIDGGPGSGNWGHTGRPGKIGGSTKGTGSKYHRQGDKYSGYTSAAKIRQKEARQYKSLKKAIGKGITEGQMKQTVGDIQKEIKANGGKVTLGQVKKAGEAVNSYMMSQYDSTQKVVDAYEKANSKEVTKMRQEYQAWEADRNKLNCIRRGLATPEDYGLDDKGYEELKKKNLDGEHHARMCKLKAEQYDIEYETEKLNLETEMALYGKERLTKTLSSIRSVGGVDESFRSRIEGSGRLKENVATVFNHLPESWVDEIFIEGIYIRELPAGARSSYSTNSFHEGKLNLAADSKMHTTYHEVGHMIEDRIPRALDITMEFYQSRTSGQKSTQLSGYGYSKGEVSKKDNFVDEYIGKEYSGATEVLSMGLQYAYTDQLTMASDSDMSNLIYGILATL